jgi:hypothetical protein
VVLEQVHEMVCDLNREDGTSDWSLPPHPREVFAQTPSRFLAVHKAKLRVNVQANAIALKSDGVMQASPFLLQHPLDCLCSFGSGDASCFSAFLEMEQRSDARLPSAARVCVEFDTGHRRRSRCEWALNFCFGWEW